MKLYILCPAHFYWLLLIYPSTTKVAADYPDIHAGLGDTISVECNSTKASSLHWTTADEREISSHSCKTCNIRTKTTEDANGGSRAVLTLTPYNEKDYGKYKCRGVTNDGVTTLEAVTIKEKIIAGTTACTKALAKSKFLKASPPLCEKDGSYKVVQLKKVGNKNVYWCVDTTTGVKIGKEDRDIYALPCTPIKISLAVSIGILLCIQAVILLFDLFLYFKFGEGIIAHIVRRREHQYKQLDAKKERKMTLKQHDISSLQSD